MQNRTIPLRQETDIIVARKFAKDLAASLGFGLLEQVQLATAVSELARNAIQYAGGGELALNAMIDGNRSGLELICEDHGPGITDLDLVLAGGYSTGHGLGRGLSGSRALLDEFSVDTAPERGTTVRGLKWLSRRLR